MPTEDHPRVCGENQQQISRNYNIAGSPPRMRGKRSSSSGTVSSRRITPAYAGKTPSRLRTGGNAWDHPRVCGENQQQISRNYNIAGSPPRMRGKPLANRPKVRYNRITPAYAGKTRFYPTAACCPRDHPRVCGENTKKIL